MNFDSRLFDCRRQAASRPRRLAVMALTVSVYFAAFVPMLSLAPEARAATSSADDGWWGGLGTRLSGSTVNALVVFNGDLIAAGWLRLEGEGVVAFSGTSSD